MQPGFTTIATTNLSAVCAANSSADTEADMPPVGAANGPQAGSNERPADPFQLKAYLWWTIGERVSDILARVARVPHEWLR
jgi:hypothetical protein